MKSKNDCKTEVKFNTIQGLNKRNSCRLFILFCKFAPTVLTVWCPKFSIKNIKTAKGKKKQRLTKQFLSKSGVQTILKIQKYKM